MTLFLLVLRFIVKPILLNWVGHSSLFSISGLMFRFYEFTFTQKLKIVDLTSEPEDYFAQPYITY